MTSIIKAIIIENDLRYVTSLKTMLADIPELVVIGEANDVKFAVELIKTSQPDLVFLDIELNGGTGFDVLSYFPDIQFDVIFTTAYEGYAVDAIKLSAVDYLLKPFGLGQIKEAIDRMLKKNGKPCVQQLVKDLKKENLQDKTIALHSHDGINFVPLSEIIYCKADSNYTVFYTTTNQEIMVCSPLKKYDDLLSNKHFFRLHQTYLINLKFVKKFIKNNGGDILLTNDVILPVSRRKKDELLALLKQISI